MLPRSVLRPARHTVQDWSCWLAATDESGSSPVQPGDAMQPFTRLRLYDCIGLSGGVVLCFFGLLMALGWLVDHESLRAASAELHSPPCFSVQP